MEEQLNPKQSGALAAQNEINESLGAINPMPAEKPSESKETKPGKLKLIIILVLGIFVVSGIAYGSWWGYQKFFSADPVEVFWQALSNSYGYEKVEVDGKINTTVTKGILDPTGRDSSSLDVISDLFSSDDQHSLALTFLLRSDATNQEAINSEANFFITVDGNNYGELEVLIINSKDIYLRPKIKNIPLGIASLELPEQWIKVDENSLVESGTESNITKDQFVASLKDNNALNIEVLDTNDQTLGEQAYVYIISLDRVGTNAAVRSLISKVEDEDRRDLLDKRFQEFSDEEWKPFSDLKIKVWVSPDEKQFRKFAIDQTIKTEEGNIALDFSMTFKKLADNTTFTAPSETVSLEEYGKLIMEQMMGGSFEDAQAKSRDAKRVADIKQMQTALELCYTAGGQYPVQLVPGDFPGDFECAPNTTISDYIYPLPTDPNNTTPYTYRYYSSDGADYQIVFSLEGGVGGLSAGVNTASIEGIHSGVDELIFGAFSPEDVMMSDDIDSAGLSGDELNDNTIESSSNGDLNTDWDGDNLSNDEEINIWGTDPLNPDTDGDGYFDGDEVANGYNPNGEGKLNE
ncbi:MAG: hypothetical protein Q8Q23_02120 [bacterium]|nr:hypothetical protein [bacterium]